MTGKKLDVVEYLKVCLDTAKEPGGKKIKKPADVCIVSLVLYIIAVVISGKP